MMFFLGRATLTVALAVAVTGIAAAVPNGTAPTTTLAVPATMVLKGSVIGGPGVKLNCSSVGVEFHNAQGGVVGKGTTTPGAGGACSYAVSVPYSEKLALTGCASLLSKNSLDGLAFAPATSKLYSSSLNHETLGTLGTLHVFSSVVTLNGSTDEIKISTGP
jgi:hypothetical protein